MTQAALSQACRQRVGGAITGSALIGGLLWLQGVYYLVTGVWPLISIRSFQMVTGYKTDNLPSGREADHWLVMGMSVLITAIALTLVVSAWRRNRSVEIALLATGSAIGLTSIDVIYVARQVIAPIYLLDAAIQLPLIAAWVISTLQSGLLFKPDR
jgi:hypothetical protein